MARLAKPDLETVVNFLRDKIDADDLPQIVEILTRNADADADADPEKSRDVPLVDSRGHPLVSMSGGGPAAPPMRGGAMDAQRRDFEKQFGITPRKIRVLG